jgi:hypothetical protein
LAEPNASMPLLVPSTSPVSNDPEKMSSTRPVAATTSVVESAVQDDIISDSSAATGTSLPTKVRVHSLFRRIPIFIVLAMMYEIAHKLCLQILSTENLVKPTFNTGLKHMKASIPKRSRLPGKSLGVDIEHIQADIPFSDGPHASAHHRSLKRQAEEAPGYVSNHSDDESSSGDEPIDIAPVTDVLERATEPSLQRKSLSLKKPQQSATAKSNKASSKGVYNEDMDWTYDAIYEIDAGSEFDADTISWAELMQPDAVGRTYTARMSGILIPEWKTTKMVVVPVELRAVKMHVSFCYPSK